MAWDTEKTKQLLLDAATQEFSKFGLAGSRVDRIAATAGVNKERIYQYFGKKNDLFRLVLERELKTVMDAVSITGQGIQAVTDYAGAVFDYQVSNPTLSRLTFWEGLELEEPVSEDFRVARCRSKARRLREALPALSLQDAREILITITTLCDGWQVLANSDRVMTETVRRDAARNASRRAAIVHAIAAMTQDILNRSTSPTAATEAATVGS